MKSRDAYDKVEEKNHTEEFSVELEEVFFDSVSDHFEEQRRDWPGKQLTVTLPCCIFTVDRMGRK
jgi:hypothetical protein